MSQELNILIEGFRPRFGDDRSISIAGRIAKVRKLQSTIKKHNQRVNSLKRAVEKKTETEKRLEYEESNLIRILKEFNEQ